MEEIKATLVHVRFRSPEGNWLIANMKNSATGEAFTATGDILYSENQEEVYLHGEWIEKKDYGKQFKVDASCRVLPSDVSGLRNYLAHSDDIKGIGPKRAANLTEHFGSKLIAILDTAPEKLIECPGISPELAKRIAAGWQRDSSVRQITLFLTKHGISARWAGRILKQWDAGTAMARIEANPYSLTAIDGIGFTTADEIAQGLGCARDSVERTEAACLYVISESIQKGNTFLHEGEVITEVCRITRPRSKVSKDTESKLEVPKGVAADAVKERLEAVIARKELVAEVVSDGYTDFRLIYMPWLHRAEKGLAERVADLNEYEHETPVRLEAVLTEVQEQQRVKFSDRQMEAIRGVFRNHTMVITGGPGTGKTTCTKAICSVAERLGINTILCAPTGRAAKRLSEVTDRSATTIHRLLKWRESGPTHTRDNPIDADVLIIDESSMLDLDLAFKLFEAVPNSCSVVLIGDVDQLPAIGAGTTLRDVISSKAVCTVILDTIFRQAESSLIVRNAHLIRRGEAPRFPETKGVAENSYVLWIPTNSNKEISGRDDAVWAKEKLARLVSVNIPEKFSKGSKPIDPIRDIQVLVPMKKYTLGAHELNRTLQEALNPNGEKFSAGGKAFRYGDRVMQMRNNYNEGMDVYNGDIGFVLSHSVEDKTVDIDFDGRTVSYPYESMDDLQLAYAQTIHKAQGSEYPVVVIVMGYQHWPMLERNLIYTANTRAKELCLFMASKGAIERAVKNNPVKERNTYLAQRLRAYMAKEATSA